MDNTIINIRIKDKHFQWIKGSWYPIITYNTYWENGKWREEGWFKVYKFIW